MIEVRVPPSKSVTQRALVLAALGRAPCRIVEPLDCDDSRALSRGLTILGARIDRGAERWTVHPLEVPIPARGPRLDLGNAGTAVRFVTGLASILDGSYVIDGDEAMRSRPMPGLLGALRVAGIGVEEQGRAGCPPIRLSGKAPVTESPSGPLRFGLSAGGSSQELSALLLAGCRLPGGAVVEVAGELPSLPYVELTRAVMRSFGVVVEQGGPGRFLVPAALPDRAEYSVEADWSSASYPLAAAWLTGRPVRVTNLSRDSLQGDRIFPELLERLSGPGPREIDLTDTPDLAPTLVACALFAAGETVISGAAHLRIKESDRIGVPVRELRKLGADIEERSDGVVVRPKRLNGPATLDPARDHRLAMAFGLVSLRIPGMEIGDPGCVTKSYPDYWSMLEVFR
jgi:3-phosphoshikimate 1-carboxyvinyltransferase